MTEYKNISVKVCGNPDANSGFQTIAQYNSPLFAIADKEYGGVQLNSHFFTLRIEPAQVIYKLIKNNVRSGGAFRAGTLVIAMSIPKGYKLNGNITPYDVLMRLKDSFLDRCMTLKDSAMGTYEFNSGIINHNVLDDVAQMFTLVPHKGPYHPMATNSTAVGCVTVDEIKIGQLLADVQYSAFSNFSEVIIAPSIQSGAYVQIPNITIPRKPQYNIIENGVSKGIVADSNQITTINGGKNSLYYDNKEVKFSIVELIAGKQVEGVQIDIENEAIHVNRSLLATPRQQVIRIVASPKEMANRLKPSDIAVSYNGNQLKVNNDLTLLFTGEEIAMLAHPEYFNVGYYGTEPYMIRTKEVRNNELHITFEKNAARNVATPVAARDMGTPSVNPSGNYAEFTLSFSNPINIPNSKPIQLSLSDEEIVYRIYSNQDTLKQHTREIIRKNKEGKYECNICLPKAWVSSGVTLRVEIQKRVLKTRISSHSKGVISNFELDTDTPSKMGKVAKFLAMGAIVGAIIGFVIGYLLPSPLGGKQESQSKEEIDNSQTEIKLEKTGKSEEPQEPMPFCSICNEPFDSQEALNNHNDSMHPFACPYDGCTMRFSTPDDLKKHQNSEGHLFKCPKCELKFMTRDEVDQHVARKHNDTRGGTSTRGGGQAQNGGQSQNRQQSASAGAQGGQVAAQPAAQPAAQAEPAAQAQAPKEEVTAPAETFKCRTCGQTFPTKRERNAHQSECKGN